MNVVYVFIKFHFYTALLNPKVTQRLLMAHLDYESNIRHFINQQQNNIKKTRYK